MNLLLNGVYMDKETLDNMLDFNPDTGRITWKFSRGTAKAGSDAGSFDKDGYRTICINRKNYKSHRLMWLHVNGEFPPEGTDHINGVRDDNRITNIRAAGQDINNRNAKKRDDNTSGITGVYWVKRARKWYAQIRTGNNRVFLGSFDCKYKAASKRKFAEEIYGFSARHGC